MEPELLDRRLANKLVLGVAVVKAVLFAAVMVTACAERARPVDPTVTSAPSPGNATPASPATAWTTSGGPASAGAPSTGTVVDPSIEDTHDGGVW